MTITSADAWGIVNTEKKQSSIASEFWLELSKDSAGYVSSSAKKGIGELESMSIQMAPQTRKLLSNTGAYPNASP